MPISATGYIFEYISQFIIRAEEQSPSAGTALIRGRDERSEAHKFHFVPQAGYEPYGLLRHVNTQFIVCGKGTSHLKLVVETDEIREDALFAFDLEDKTIIHWRTKDCWKSGPDQKNVKLATPAKGALGPGTKYFFEDCATKVKSPYPITKSWKLIKAITAHNHSGTMTVKYTVGLSVEKSRELRAGMTTNIGLVTKIAQASFGFSLSTAVSQSKGTQKTREESLVIKFGEGHNPQGVTCVWQFHPHIPEEYCGFEVGQLGDIIYVTNDYNPPKLEDKDIEKLGI